MVFSRRTRSNPFISPLRSDRTVSSSRHSYSNLASLLKLFLMALLFSALIGCTQTQASLSETFSTSGDSASSLSASLDSDAQPEGPTASAYSTVASSADCDSANTSPEKANTPYSYLIMNAPSVTTDEITSYDFSAVAWKYMTEISTLFPNRNVNFGSRPGGFPQELLGETKHDDAARYILYELTAHGYQDISSKDSEVATALAIDTDNPTDSNSNNNIEQSNPTSTSDTSADHHSDTDGSSNTNDATAHSADTAATVRTLPTLMDFTLSLKEVCNITARLKGKDSSKQIIVGAHYDGDGAGDNASGTSLLLAVACGLKEHDIIPPVDIVFIFFDAEEIGFFGSKEYAENMTEEEIKSTLYMVNIDSIAFGDYCNLFGGRFDTDGYTVTGLDAYQNAIEVADKFDIKTCLIDQLDGYFAAHGTGPALDDTTIFTNPWTDENPPPKNYQYPSPMTGPWSDHEAFSREGIDIIYFEASNMFAVGDGKYDCYSGYYESYDDSIGYYGMFMNTEYDTLENLETYFPGRARKHLSLFSRLLTALLQSKAPSSF